MAEREYPWVSHGEWRSRVLEHDPVTGITEHYFYNPYTNQQFIHEVNDIRRSLAVTKASFAQTDSHAPWSFDEDAKLGTKVAHVPNALLPDLWKRSAAGKDQEVLSRWVTDPENRHFLYRPVLYGIGRAVGGDITR